MRKIALLSSVLALGVGLSVGTSGISAYGMAGCGLGSMVIKDTGPAQILAATTNGISSNQTIGMTFGISNCPKGQAIFRAQKEKKEQEVFVTVNFGALEQEMASGKGEKLSAFSELLGCKNHRAFGEMARKNYGDFFGVSGEVTPSSLLASVRKEVISDSANTCKL